MSATAQIRLEDSTCGTCRRIVVSNAKARQHLDRPVVAIIEGRTVPGKFTEVEGKTQFVAASGRHYTLGEVSEFTSVDPRAPAAELSGGASSQSELVVAGANLAQGVDLWATHSSISPAVADALRETSDDLRAQLERTRGTLLGAFLEFIFARDIRTYDELSELVRQSGPRLEGINFFAQFLFTRGIGARKEVDLSGGLKQLAPKILSAPQSVKDALGFLLAAGFTLRTALEIAEKRFGEHSQASDQRSWSQQASLLAQANGIKSPSQSMHQAIATALAAVEGLPFLTSGGTLRAQQAETIARLEDFLKAKEINADVAREVAGAVGREASVTPATFADLWHEMIRVQQEPEENSRLRSFYGPRGSVRLESVPQNPLHSIYSRASYQLKVRGRQLCKPGGQPLSGETHVVVGRDGLLYAKTWAPEDLWGYAALGYVLLELDGRGAIERLLSSTRPYRPNAIQRALPLLALAHEGVDLLEISCGPQNAQEYLDEIIRRESPVFPLLRLLYESLGRGPTVERAVGTDLASPSSASPLQLPRTEHAIRRARVGDSLSWARGTLVKEQPELLTTLCTAINLLLQEEDVLLDELLVYALGVMGDDWPEHEQITALALIELLAMSPLASAETVMQLLGRPTSAARRAKMPAHPEREIVLTPNISPDAAARWHYRTRLSADERAPFRGASLEQVVSAGAPEHMLSRTEERVERFLVTAEAILPHARTVQWHSVQVTRSHKETQWESQPPPTGDSLALRQEVFLCMLKADLARDGLPTDAVNKLEESLRQRLGLSRFGITPKSLVDEAVALFGHRSFVFPMPAEEMQNRNTMYSSTVDADRVQLFTPDERERARFVIRDHRPAWETGDRPFTQAALAFASEGAIYGLDLAGIPQTPDEFRLLGRDAVSHIDLSFENSEGKPRLRTQRRNYRPPPHHRVLALLKLAREGLNLADWDFTPYGHRRQFDRYMAAYRGEAPASAQTVRGFLEDFEAELKETGIHTPLDAITWLLLQRREEILAIPLLENENPGDFSAGAPQSPPS